MLRFASILFDNLKNPTYQLIFAKRTDSVAVDFRACEELGRVVLDSFFSG